MQNVTVDPYPMTQKDKSRCTDLYKRKQTNKKQTNAITENKWEKKRIKTREIEIEAPSQGEEIKYLPPFSPMKVLIKSENDNDSRPCDRKKKLK